MPSLTMTDEYITNTQQNVIDPTTAAFYVLICKWKPRLNVPCEISQNKFTYNFRDFFIVLRQVIFKALCQSMSIEISD